MNMSQQRLVIIVICLALLLGGGADALLGMGAVGYTSGYEGVRASFAGIDYQSGSDPRGQANLIGTSFVFDSDDPIRYAPNLVGEMTNAFVPEQSIKPAWVFQDLWTNVQYIKNPVDSFEWNLPNPDDAEETRAYRMEEWILRMYVSITTEWDDAGDLVPKWETERGGETRYKNTEVWIELDVSPIWYFEGADHVYFGLAKVVTSDVAFGVLGKTDENYSPTDQCSVIPNSGTTYRYLYYSKYGETEITPTDPKTFQGRTLNPEIFVDRMFINVNLVNFGTQQWGNPLSGWNYKGDAITWGFDVHVFVVGEWNVKDVEEIPDTYGRTPQYEMSWSYWVGRFLADPRGQFWLLVGLVALVVLVLAVFAPWVLISLFSIVKLSSGSGRK